MGYRGLGNMGSRGAAKYGHFEGGCSPGVEMAW